MLLGVKGLKTKASSFVMIILLLSVGSVIFVGPAEKSQSGNLNETASTYQENQETPKYGGTLRIATRVQTLNPLVDASYGYVFDFYPVFNGLLRYDENGTLISDLAKSYEVLEDGRTIIFHLYQNVSWHDGIEFNASDVKFTFDTIYNDPQVQSYWRDYYAYGINSTEIVNATTIVFNLIEPLGAFPFYVSFVPILPKHIYEGTDLGTNPANYNPIGTGPFKFSQWPPGGKNLTFVANENYFRGRPYLDSVIYRWGIPALNLINALENNLVDVIAGCVDPSRIEELEMGTGTGVTLADAPEYWYLGFNLSNPILNNTNVRRAIAYAINKTRIVVEPWLGYATVATGPIPPSFEKWYNPNVTRYECNRTLAEQMLDQECPRNPEWRFNLTIKSTGKNAPWLANTAYLVRDDLRAVGINATIEFCKLMELEAFDDAVLVGWRYDAYSPDDLYAQFHTGSIANSWNYSNSELDALLEKGRKSFNETERKIVFDQVQDIVVADLPNISLFYPYSATAFNNDFHGISIQSVFLVTQYILENTWYDPTLSGEGNCPYRVCFIDSEGRRTGFFNGTVYQDIPNSTYTGVDSDPQLVKIRNPLGTYTVELIGIENGSYEFEFVNIALDYKKVWMKEGYIHENETITYMVRVYEDGTLKVYSLDKFSPYDLGITSISLSETVVGEGFDISINARIFNYGDFTENFNVTVCANMTEIEKVEINLASGKPIVIALTWNTAGFAKGNYTVKAIADTLPEEIDVEDNTFDGWVLVTYVGDFNGDFRVDYLDDRIFGRAYITYGQTGEIDPRCDLNDDGKIDYLDDRIFGRAYIAYGQTH
jgi:peptide/nickel transport system substrate-binding protein